MRVWTGRQAIEQTYVRILVMVEEAFAHCAQRRDFAVRVSKLLHGVLTMQVCDELERLALVLGAARDHQDVDVAIRDVTETWIERRKRRGGPMTGHRRFVGHDEVCQE